MALPSSKAVYDKMQHFRPEPLERRDQRFEEIIDAAGLRDECVDMLKLLKEQTNQSRLKYTRVGDPWRGQKPSSLGDVQISEDAAREKKAAEQEMQETLGLLKQHGVEVVRVDIAIGPGSAVLVGYNSRGGDMEHAALVDKLARFFNNCLLTEGSMVTKDSTIYQARSLAVLQLDASGQPLPGEIGKIDQALHQMKKRISSKGIEFQLHQHDYATVKPKVAEEATAKAKPKAPDQEGPRTAPEAG